MNIGRSNKGRKATLWVGGAWFLAKIVYKAFDFLAAKIGWLGIFTSPEDFRTMLERLPEWLEYPLDYLAPYITGLVAELVALLAKVTSYNGLSVVLIAILALLVFDIDRLMNSLSFFRFKLRSKMSETVWIDEDRAFHIIRESDWGKLTAPHVVVTKSLFDNITGISNFTVETTTYGMSEKNKAVLKFKTFVRRTLAKFAEDNPNMVRDTDGGREFDEAGIRRFLDELLDIELQAEFGQIPRVTLDEG